MLKQSLAILFILALLLPTAVFAQGQALTLPSVEVDLWPEYDRPGVLVIYHLTLPASVSLPADVTVRIPAAAGKPNAVAVRQADGSLVNVPYDPQTSGEWSLINLKASTPEVQVEYYDPGLVVQGTARHFAYKWPGDYAVDSMVVKVQQPAGASDMTISPTPGNTFTANDGLVYHTTNVGALATGQSFEITLDYQKFTDSLTAPTLDIYPSAPINETTAGRLTLISVLPWIAGALGLLLIAGGAFWYWQSGREKPALARRARHKPAAEREATGPAAPPVEDGRVYCHNCGKRAGPGDRFCRTCGTPLRAA